MNEEPKYIRHKTTGEIGPITRTEEGEISYPDFVYVNDDPATEFEFVEVVQFGTINKLDSDIRACQRMVNIRGNQVIKVMSALKSVMGLIHLVRQRPDCVGPVREFLTSNPRLDAATNALRHIIEDAN